MKSKDEAQQHTPYKGGVNNRRKRAAERLKAQLGSGIKPEFVIKLKGKKEVLAQTDKTTPLTDSDRKRIDKELAVLKTRVRG